MMGRALLFTLFVLGGLATPALADEVVEEAPKAAPAAPAAPAPGARGRHGNPLLGLSRETWDWNLELMVGPVLEPGHDDTPWTFATRMRGGLLVMRGPYFWQIGATAELSSFQWEQPSFGAQVELLHFTSGFWWQVGGFVDLEANGGMSAGAGWTLLGLETQFRTRQDDDALSWAVLLKVRAPLRMLFRMF